MSRLLSFTRVQNQLCSAEFRSLIQCEMPHKYFLSRSIPSFVYLSLWSFEIHPEACLAIYFTQLESQLTSALTTILWLNFSQTSASRAEWQSLKSSPSASTEKIPHEFLAAPCNNPFSEVHMAYAEFRKGAQVENKCWVRDTRYLSRSRVWV